MSELKQILTNISEEKVAKIIPENIKAGVNVFNVEGTFTSDATATAEDILSGKTAYVNGVKVEGIMEKQENLTKYIKNCASLFKGDTTITELHGFDCSSATSLSYMFESCSNLTSLSLKNVNKVTKFDYLVQYCKKLKEIKIEGNMTSSVDINCNSTFNGCSILEKVTLPSNFKPRYMTCMFMQCPSLVDIPVIDTSKLTIAQYCFTSSPNLSDESLNNILLMLASATKYEKTKTLADIGLTSDQATRCQSLSNYQAFLDAGWTTGY